jgi:DNA repair exonuclease SbcCD ATPase subunit
MIQLKSLKWSNCFSYGADNYIDLAENNLTQIIGPNGVGKSAIPLILEEVLYNKNSKGIKKVDISNRETSSNEYNISLDFSVYEDEYKIKLRRSKTLKVSLFKNSEDISSHTATNTFKTIEGILGIDFKTFSQLIYQGPTSSLQFLTATDTIRKKFLIDLLNLTKYTEFFEVFKEKVKEYNTKNTALASKIETVKSWLLKNNLNSMKVSVPKIIEIETETEGKELNNLQIDFLNISENNKKITKNNHYREQLASINLSKASSINVDKEESFEEHTKIEGEMLAKEKRLLAYIRKIKELGNKCPTCEQEIEEDFKYKLFVNTDKELFKVRKLLTSTQQIINQIKENNKKFKVKEKIQREFESLFRSVDSTISIELVNAKELEDKINDLKEVLKNKKIEIAEIEAYNLKIEKNNSKISLIKEQSKDFETQLAELETFLAEVQGIFSNLEILKKAFSTNGLLAYKIENLVKELEYLTNQYLAELSDGEFTLEFVVLKDKLNVNMTKNEKLVDILSLSSGELSRVNTSTLLAIRKLMNSISKSQINVLFLDEVIATLDSLGRDRLVEVLSKETSLNTFIVSHEWTHPLLAKLSIVKEKELSRVDHDNR